MTMLRRLGRAATAVVLLACAASPSATIATTTFEPSLGIDTTVMTPLRGGLWYRDLEPGTGAEATRGRTVAVYYTGLFASGSEFEATQPPDEPVRFRLGAGEVIAGWDRGIAGMRVGGRRQLVIPPALAYGSRGTDRIPPNAVLVFTIELVEVR